ncbi:MAG TPA: sigma-70 family RNA polymerase sigma factor [Spirochaetota bacterium]|nr:sigma-70 family RNA polymerase sigma factor [Spirochaetota bacterium]
MDSREHDAFFNDCYKKNKPRVYRYILSKTRNIETAEDICQETFLVFSQKLKNRQAYEPARLLIGIARNKTRDYRRTRGTVETIDIDDRSIECSKRLVYRSKDHDLGIILGNAKAALTPLELDILERTCTASLTGIKTASELGLTRRQVTYRLKTARAKIYLHLQKSGINNATGFTCEQT